MECMRTHITVLHRDSANRPMYLMISANEERYKKLVEHEDK